MKEDRAIVFHCNRDHVFALGAMLYNLAERSVSCSRIIVYTDFDDDAVFEKLCAVNGNMEFHCYPLEEFFKEFGMRKESRNIRAYSERYTHLCYIKFKIFELLARFRQVLFMDLDMYIMENFDEVFSLDCDIAWRSGVSLLSKFRKGNLDPVKVPWLAGADERTPAPNGGFIMVRDTCDYEECCRFSKEFFCRHAEFFSSTIDEIVFSVAVLCKRLRLITLDRTVYNTPLQMFSGKTKIIHFIGGETKPWSNVLLQCLFPGWLKNYRLFSEKTHIVSDKVIMPGAMDLRSCRLEIDYGNAQKYGIAYEPCGDAMKCFLTFNSVRYPFPEQALLALGKLGSRQDDGESGQHPGTLYPEDLMPNFMRLLEQAGKSSK